ncbi:hypothetical protein LTR84_010901 [Exophiala bonariae]|uniref:Uncharacterized protein n=1 Tax=Exophiala bonariae TaxID=1690606 RepID=A0AAV9NHP9_9EURO|nr:hypothetical protein LTR84_010901 [Exophiala bonariae]
MGGDENEEQLSGMENDTLQPPEENLGENDGDVAENERDDGEIGPDDEETIIVPTIEDSIREQRIKLTAATEAKAKERDQNFTTAVDLSRSSKTPPRKT